MDLRTPRWCSARGRVVTCAAMPASSFYLGRYNCIEPLGGGPAAEVFRAKIYGVAGFEKEFAVKRIRAELLEDAPFVARFVEASKAAAALEHEGLARVFEVSVQGAQIYLVIELMRGVSFADLAEAAARAHGLPPVLVCHIAAEALRALAAAHEHQGPEGPRPLWHHGLSPSNVWVTPEGRVKIGDYGLFAAHRRGDWTRDERLRDRLGYLAPELLHGAPGDIRADGRADVFGIGALLYAVAAGQPPFEGATADATVRAVLEATPAVPPLPAPLARVVGRLLEKDPQARPAAAAAAQLLTEAIRMAGQLPDRAAVTSFVRRLADAAPERPAPSLEAAKRHTPFESDTVPFAKEDTLQFEKEGPPSLAPAPRRTKPLGTVGRTPPPLPPGIARTAGSNEAETVVGKPRAGVSSTLIGVPTTPPPPAGSAHPAPPSAAHPAPPAPPSAAHPAPPAPPSAAHPAPPAPPLFAENTLPDGLEGVVPSPGTLAPSADSSGALTVRRDFGSVAGAPLAPPLPGSAPPAPPPAVAPAPPPGMAPHGHRPDVPPDVALPRRGSAAGISLVIAAIVVLAAGSLGAGGWWYFSRRPAPVAVPGPVAVAVPDPARDPAVAPAAAPAAAPAPAPAPAAAPAPVPAPAAAPPPVPAPAPAPDQPPPAAAPAPAAPAVPAAPAAPAPAPAPAGGSAPLAVASRPAGAIIFIDGHEHGRTPATVPVSPGAHKVLLLRDGSRLWRGDVEVPAGGAKLDQELPPASPADLPSRGRASLRVQCEGRARVSIDDTDIGLGCNTPRIYLAPGEHKVDVFFAAGDHTHTERVNVLVQAHSTYVRVKAK
ncbi:MAG TPA: protein kinase [Polyangia bacterium]